MINELVTGKRNPCTVDVEARIGLCDQGMPWQARLWGMVSLLLVQREVGLLSTPAITKAPTHSGPGRLVLGEGARTSRPGNGRHADRLCP